MKIFDFISSTLVLLGFIILMGCFIDLLFSISPYVAVGIGLICSGFFVHYIKSILTGFKVKKVNIK